MAIFASRNLHSVLLIVLSYVFVVVHAFSPISLFDLWGRADKQSVARTRIFRPKFERRDTLQRWEYVNQAEKSTYFPFSHSSKTDPKPKWDGVFGSTDTEFKYDDEVSDEFDGRHLNEDKWSPTGLTNGNTGCPKWNGPVDWEELDYSTYFQTPRELDGSQIHPFRLNYRFRAGRLHLRVTEQPQSYFEAREYYCDPVTFRCNHNPDIACYGTNYNGDAVLSNRSDPTSYVWANHDKCKMEPYCIPSPRFVTKSPRKYKRFLGVSIAGKKLFKYGFFETKVLIAQSSALTAVWMHDDNYDPPFARWTNDPNGYPFLETPSHLRSRRWQEIDILEAMNSEVDDIYKKYIPNVHIFAGYKGEFTEQNSQPNRLGPIVLDKEVIEQKNPRFESSNTTNNEFHLNYGNTHDLSIPWAMKWRTIGMYWSPTEIRFLVDGKETLRLRNTLTHQPMFFTISTGLNRPWAGRKPRSYEIGRWTKIDYIRRWEVFTNDGKEPPSKLDLLDNMPANFRFIGNNYLDVEGKFPIDEKNHEYGETLPDPAARFFGGLLRSASKDFIETNRLISRQFKTGARRMLRAGGLGNRHRVGYTGYVDKFSSEERLQLLSQNPDQRATHGNRECGEKSKTAFEFTNPEAIQAGWATTQGNGREAGVVPRSYCT